MKCYLCLGLFIGFAFIHGVEKGFSGAPSPFGLGLAASNPGRSASHFGFPFIHGVEKGFSGAAIAFGSA